MYLVEIVGALPDEDQFKIITEGTVSDRAGKPKKCKIGDFVDIGEDDSVGRLLGIGSLQNLQSELKRLLQPSIQEVRSTEIINKPSSVGQIKRKGVLNLKQARKQANSLAVIHELNLESHKRQKISKPVDQTLEVVTLKRQLLEKDEEIVTLKAQLSSMSNTGDVNLHSKVDEALGILKTAFPSAKKSPVDNSTVYISDSVSIAADAYALINFSDPISAAKDLVLSHFGRNTLANCNLTGKKCPTKFGDPKPPLCALDVSAIMGFVINKYRQVNRDSLEFYCKKTKSLQILNASHLKEAIRQKTYSCSKFK